MFRVPQALEEAQKGEKGKLQQAQQAERGKKKVGWRRSGAGSY